VPGLILVLYGADELGLRRRLGQLKEEADGGTGMLATNLTVVSGRDAKVHEIVGPAMSPPFLAPKRLVIVDALLDRYEQGNQRQPRSLDPVQPLLAALAAGVPDSSMLVFTGGAGKRNALIERLRKTPGVQVEEHPELKGDQLLRYIREEAAARGVRFRGGPEADPARMLANMLGSDTLGIANELDKLALYTMGRDVTPEDVGKVCAAEREASAFDFVDGVMDGNPRAAFAALQSLRKQGENPQGVLALLTDGYRTSATVLDLLEDGATPEEIGKAIRRPWPYLRDKAIARARRLGQAGVMAAYAAIVEADRTTKLGEVDEDLAFDLLVARLSTLGSPAAQRR
jgi:DNA polymerase-3 subunit delta